METNALQCVEVDGPCISYQERELIATCSILTMVRNQPHNHQNRHCHHQQNQYSFKFLSCYTVILAPTEAVRFVNFDCVNNLVFQLSPLGWLVGIVAHQAVHWFALSWHFPSLLWEIASPLLSLCQLASNNQGQFHLVLFGWTDLVTSSQLTNKKCISKHCHFCLNLLPLMTLTFKT